MAYTVAQTADFSVAAPNTRSSPSLARGDGRSKLVQIRIDDVLDVQTELAVSVV